MTGQLPRQTVLVVDDLPENIAILVAILSPHYRVKAARSGEAALKVACLPDKPDIILLDIMMPGLDGYDVCRALKENPATAAIPVIFVTAMTETEDEAHGFATGAVDYITKPISPPIVKARVRTHLALYDQNRVLEELVGQRTEELARTRDVTIHSLAVLAETRDNETGNHIMRTQRYILVLAEELADRGLHSELLQPVDIEMMFKSAPLHDIGKVGIPDAILLKPGQLTDEEFEIMKTHSELGYQALARAEEELGSSSFLNHARDIALTHHEKWDGSGYPKGLAGTDIPLSGRLMALADVYDALISKRCYKPAFSHEKSAAIILEGRGSHFDPDVVDAFQAREESFREIAAQFKDREMEDCKG